MDAIFTVDADQNIRIYQVDKEQITFIYNGKSSNLVYAAAIHFGLSRLAFATMDHRIGVWNWLDGSIPIYETPMLEASISQLVFRPDGNQLLSATTDGTIAVWSIDGDAHNVDSDDYWITQAPQEPTILTYTPNGAIIMASWGDESIRLWDAQSFQLLGSIASQHGPILDIDFSPDGKLMAMATEHAIEFWEVSIPAQISAQP
ncbi:MAG: hypothetical protein R3A44_05670 [Caldilineaceae bacterium]